MTVHLVGAGPGDPELLTVRAVRLLARADVVVHDALVSDDVLGLVRDGAELIDVGKRPGRPLPQELISALLVSLGQRQGCVVRLKGGDPLLFGRGGEELLALREAGIEVEVVPGITSAFSAASSAGVPVTHRGVAASVTVVTGHRQAGEHEPDWEAIARVGGTIVVLMGVAQRASIARRLRDGGLGDDTPVVAVMRATTPEETTWVGRLDALGVAPIVSPATIVIGAVAALATISEATAIARAARSSAPS